MFSSGPNYQKLKTNLRLSVNRLKLLEKKKTELAQKSRKEIADYISAGKVSMNGHFVLMVYFKHRFYVLKFKFYVLTIYL